MGLHTFGHYHSLYSGRDAVLLSVVIVVVFIDDLFGIFRDVSIQCYCLRRLMFCLHIKVEKKTQFSHVLK